MRFICNTLFILMCAFESNAFNPPGWRCDRYAYFNDPGNHETTGDCGKPLILTPYINSGEIEKAQKLARVYLKEFSDVESYSGFFTVNKSCDTNMFFWYFPSERKNASDPLVLWLQGGPGKSALDGLVNEIGPFYIENENILKKRKYHWSDKRNLLFIDSPVGTGFSFNNEEVKCYSQNMDEVRLNLYRTLHQFYELFPDLQKNDLFIFGDAGKYIPALAYSIHENKVNSHVKMNLKGLGIGNGFTDPISMHNYSTMLYNIGVVNENGRLELEKLEAKVTELIREENWPNAYFKTTLLLQTVSDLMFGLDLYNYLELLSPLSNINYFNNHDVKCAIHASNVHHFTINDCVYENLIGDFTKSVKPWVEKLLESYRVMFYNGQANVLVGAAATQNFITTLKWSGAEEFKKQRQFAVHNKEIVAFGTHYGNLCEFRIRKSGHTVPKYQPKAIYDIMDNFVNDKVGDYL